jgi:fatty acid desaturase
MKLVQKYPLNWNRVDTFELTNDKLILTLTSWNVSSYNEYLLTELSPIVAKFRQGNRAFQNIAWFFFFVMVIAATFVRFWTPLFLLIPISIVVIVMSLLLFLFKKDEHEVFQNRSGETLFGIRLDGEDDEKRFLGELRKKIN